MRVGLYGGTFDPIHQGHVEPVRAAAEQLKLERVIYLPTAQPPHKRGRDTSPAWRRFAMVELALLGDPNLEVSTLEMVEREAFTIETVEHFTGELAGDWLFLIIGADSFLQLHSWRRGAELAAAIELVVLTRPGFDLDRPDLAEPQRKALAAGRVHAVNHEPIAASSSEIRRALAAGERLPQSWLDSRVLEYAVKYRLFRDDQASD